MKFESASVAKVLTGTAAWFVLAACSGTSEDSGPTAPPPTDAVPSTLPSSAFPHKTYELHCAGDGPTDGNMVLVGPGSHEFIFTAPTASTPAAIGRLSAELTVHNPPVNGRDTHLTWEWAFAPGEEATITENELEAKRHINNTTYVMNITPQAKASGQPQLAISCLSYQE